MGPDTKSEPEPSSERGATVRVGPHTIYIEEGVVHNRFAGDLSRDDMAAVLEFADQVLKRDGVVFTLNDVRGIRHISPEARRYAAQWMRGRRFDGAAVYGANLATRTLVTLLLRAINLLRSTPFESIFCATEQEGRAWINEQRQKLQHGSRPLP
jgi:hypothetical protein